MGAEEVGECPTTNWVTDLRLASGAMGPNDGRDGRKLSLLLLPLPERRASSSSILTAGRPGGPPALILRAVKSLGGAAIGN